MNRTHLIFASIVFVAVSAMLIENGQDSVQKTKAAEEKNAFQSAFNACVAVVKLDLKHPSSANFDNTAEFTKRSNGGFIVKLHYKAQNDFGGWLPSYATCVMSEKYIVETMYQSER